MQPIEPATVNSPALPIDKHVRFIMFYDPSYLSRFGYCYFAFRGWFDPNQTSPKQLALAASGFAILKSELRGYQEWLRSEPGKQCEKAVFQFSGAMPIDIAAEMAGKISIIGFNPVGAIRSDGGIAPVLDEARLTINHERIHAIHVSCPEVNSVAEKHWSDLSAKDKKKLKEGHLSYDWTNQTVAVREAFAYFLEEEPTKVLSYIVNCKLFD